MPTSPNIELKVNLSTFNFSADERDQRLMLAEEILSELASGYWVAVLDDNDDPVKERMGQRILNYWNGLTAKDSTP